MRPSLFLSACCALLLTAVPLQAAAQAKKSENIDFVAISKAQNPDANPPVDFPPPLQTAPSLKETIRKFTAPDQQQPDNPVRDSWENGSTDGDIVVQTPDAPPPKPEKPEKAAKGKDAPPPKVNVQLRKQPPEKAEKAAKNKKTAPAKSKTADTVKKPAAVVSLPSAKPAAPALTRRQILEREVRRERSALQTAKAQLAAAQKKGNAKQIAKLQSLVKDRELNIQAIEREMVR